MESAELFRQIVAQSQGELSSEEELELQNWCAASEENSIQYKELLAIYKATSSSKQPDTDASWKLVENAIKKSSSKKKINSWVWAAAAVFILSFGAWWLVPLPHDTLAFSTGDNEVKSFLLPDGTEVELNRNSYLSYTGEKDKRKVEFSGEAIFRVAKDPAHPFHISAAHTSVEVLGTRFRFTDRKTSEKAMVEVEEGKVRFTSKNQSEKIVTAGNTALFTGKRILVHPSKVELKQRSFESGLLDFQDAQLAEVAVRLEAKYGITIHFSQHEMAFCRFSGTFSNQSIEQVVQIIETTLGFESSRQGDTILFSGKPCVND